MITGSCAIVHSKLLLELSGATPSVRLGSYSCTSLVRMHIFGAGDWTEEEADVIGVVIGTVVGVLVLVAGCFHFYRRRKIKRSRKYRGVCSPEIQPVARVQFNGERS